MDFKKAYHITTAGEVKAISPANGKDFKLSEVQKLIGGYIEVVYLTPNVIAIVDEEGKIKNREPNPVATIIANSARALWSKDYIVGDVIICPSRMLR